MSHLSHFFANTYFLLFFIIIIISIEIYSVSEFSADAGNR